MGRKRENFPPTEGQFRYYINCYWKATTLRAFYYKVSKKKKLLSSGTEEFANWVKMSTSAELSKLSLVVPPVKPAE